MGPKKKLGAKKADPDDSDGEKDTTKKEDKAAASKSPRCLPPRTYAA